ncbi:MAG: helix-turn-helix domain-containing protein [Flavobacteriales bacterium]|nr:helix-turn-helix domain-containing protein [Flavobacteriales bacterium]
MAFNGKFLYQIIQQANNRGASKQLMLQCAGMSEEELLKEETKLGYEAFNNTFETAYRQCKDPMLGVNITKSMNLNAAGLILQLAQYSNTFKDAMLKACEYSLLGCSSLPMRIEKDEYSYTLIYSFDRSWRAHSELTFRHTLEGSILFLLKEYEALTQNKFSPVKITLDYAPEVGFKKLEKYYKTPVFVRDNRNTVVFRKKDFESPIATADRSLLSHLVQYANDKIFKVQNGKRDSNKVSEIIMQHLPDRVTVEEVATELNISPRTLQRKLKDENTSFRELLEQHTMEFAKSQLRKRRNSLSEIAYLLNYSDLSAFSRAFKNHYGFAPTKAYS